MALNANTMGEAINTALDLLMQEDGKPALPDAPEEQVQDRKRLFRAIAQGVIKHLKDNPDAFILEVTGTSPLTLKVTVKEIL
jgi:hypothetical protein